MRIIKDTETWEIYQKLYSLSEAKLHYEQYPAHRKRKIEMLEVHGTNEWQRRWYYYQHQLKNPNCYCSISWFYRRVRRWWLEKAINTPRLKHWRPTRDILRYVQDKNV